MDSNGYFGSFLMKEGKIRGEWDEFTKYTAIVLLFPSNHDWFKLVFALVCVCVCVYAV